MSRDTCANCKQSTQLDNKGIGCRIVFTHPQRKTRIICFDCLCGFLEEYYTRDKNMTTNEFLKSLMY